MDRASPLFFERRIRFEGNEWKVNHTVADARLVDGRIVVLFDPDAYWREFGTPQFGQFANLVAFDAMGNSVWVAELPTAESGDCYVSIASAAPLRAYSWKSYLCELDPLSGRIRERTFAK